MASISQQIKLPFIDFNMGGDKLGPDCPEWTDLKVQVKRALEEFGCFEAHFGEVPKDLQKKMIGSLQEVFELSLEIKQRNISRRPFHGYMGQMPQLPLYESMGIDDANVHEKVDEVVSTLWPQGHPTFSKTTHSYSEKLLTLDQIIRRMILESLGLENHLEEHLSSAYYLLRLNKYKKPPTAEAKSGINAHTDKSMLTILYQDQVGGLEVETKDGEWIGIKPSPESFIVMVGDSLYAWTNGRLRSPYHRVMISGSEARYSVGLFSMPKAGYIIKAPDKMVDEEHPLLFEPFDYYELIKSLRQRGGAPSRICRQDLL
ncbi:hypothetical protein CDL15_Pgr001865 [Punica granatum]|uniref:Fe2OG dioxygenase domain-containing protein n=1 Tax=Punica granatum TaxID=22663 RepID=A0A218XCQ8_PUNGR|nr:hypothetical protein CDL15_Pgr001865 [Punica granatum]